MLLKCLCCSPSSLCSVEKLFDNSMETQCWHRANLADVRNAICTGFQAYFEVLCIVFHECLIVSGWVQFELAVGR